MMDRRSVLVGSSATLLGALAITAVSSGTSLAQAAVANPQLADPQLAGSTTGAAPGLFPNLSTVTAKIPPVTPGRLSARERAHLATFDELDFVIYSGQKWDRMKESHAKNIRVHNPDGSFTDGLDVHIEALKTQFVWAPDSKVTQHPIKIAKDEMTAVVGIGSGTFTRPLPLPDGTFVPPTNQRFQFGMVTVGIWNRKGVMDEEFLFFDLQSIGAQAGLG